MNKYIILFIGIFLSSFTFAQEKAMTDSTDHLATIRHFVNELANENRAVDIILSQQIIVTEPSPELYDYLEVSLEEVRINLMSKNIEALQYIPFKQMPSKKVRDIDYQGLNPENIYFLEYKGKQMLALYVQNGKIASFTLVSKGNNKAHFVFY